MNQGDFESGLILSRMSITFSFWRRPGEVVSGEKLGTEKEKGSRDCTLC